MKISIATTSASQPVQILASEHLRFIQGGMTIDGTYVRDGQYETGKKIVKVGTRLAKITSSGLYAPVRASALASAAAAADTTIEVDDATFYMAGDALSIGGTAATIDSINYSTNVITLTAAVGADKVVDTTVLGTGGFGTAVAILYPDDIDVTNGDEAVGGIDHARVIEARLPGTVSAQEKIDLKEIAWA